MKLLLLTFLFSFGMNAEKPSHYATCTTFKCVDGHKNQRGQVQGLLRAYTPNKTGKGAGHMFWEYEILLSDSIAIPVIAKPDHTIDFASHLGEKVTIKCTFYHGVIIGGGDENAQAATGWRIDSESIAEFK